MIRKVRDWLINLITSRLFFLFLVFVALGMILIHRIFVLQIVNGEEYLNNFTLKIKKERTINSTRGVIYDRNGELLAYNELAYSVTIEDVYESGKTKNERLNATIYQLIHYIEENGDKLVNDFDIVVDNTGNYAFTVQDAALKRFLADVYGKARYDQLKVSQQTATAEEVIEYLAGKKRFAIGGYKDPDDEDSFEAGLGYTKEDVVKMVTVRYNMSLNSFQKYIATTVATEVSDETVAVIMENSEQLDGVSIAEETIRKYVDSVYFSHIIGYTGKISTEEYNELVKENDSYSLNDIIGKAGIEQVMETSLQGKKGSETVYVDNLGRVIETTDRKEPAAGNDLYLTIDKNLQKAVYNILEQKIAGILVDKIDNIKEYVAGENSSAAKIRIPIYDVYFALINNNVIDMHHFATDKAKEVEQEVYAAFLSRQNAVFATLKKQLTEAPVIYKELSTEYQGYALSIVSKLTADGVLVSSEIDREDETYLAWRNETISLKEYLEYCISKNWIDISGLELNGKYSDSDTVYRAVLDYLEQELRMDDDFSKKIYRYMIKDDLISGRQICLLLFEQAIIDGTDEELGSLKNGTKNPYNFLLEKIENMDITPAQLALDPCSGSCVVTDVNTGEILACVTYPSYDNNRLANTIDSEYYKALQEDLSMPQWDYATQQTSAPGSTFKMVSAAAGLEEGVINLNETISCKGIWETITPQSPKCWISPGAHGSLDIVGAIQNSCNYFFYETGYRLGRQNGIYDSDAGLKKLAYYADQFGLSEKSGIEITEESPHVSDSDAVRSAIGQGTNNYTTVGLARYVTTVANSGTCYELSLLDRLVDSNGNLVEDYTPKVRNQIELKGTTWNAIHLGMRKVIEDKAYYEGLGVSAAGKTGTAQESKSRPNHALFVCYAPYEQPEIAVATRIAFGYASDYSAQMTRDILKYYFKLEDEENIITGTAATQEAVNSNEQ